MTQPPDDCYRDRRVTVMGLGKFGGGAAAARFLAERGARVTVTDLQSPEELSSSLALLDDVPIERQVLGRHYADDFTSADLVVVNPAVPRRHGLLQLARRHHVPLTTEISLFWHHHRGRVIGVTGSNGKSTTAAMIHHILSHAGFTARLGGNIGVSLLDQVDDIAPNDWTVLELSSFQLEWLDEQQVSPQIAVVTNFSPNHLDRHGTLEQYRHAKQAILRWQSGESVAVLNAVDTDVISWPTRGQKVECDHKNIELRQLSLPGRHQRENAALAIGAAEEVGVNRATSTHALRSFRGLPHRQQVVAERQARVFVNDSLATTPESAIAALHSFDQPIVILAGGADKGVDLSEFASEIARRAKFAALMGDTATTLAELLKKRDCPPERYRVCRTFEEAFDHACAASVEGDVVLLSPGCASFGWFQNFADRGERFAQLALEWPNLQARLRSE